MEKIMLWIVAIWFSLFIVGSILAGLVTIYGWPILAFLPIIGWVDYLILKKLSVLKKS